MTQETDYSQFTSQELNIKKLELVKKGKFEEAAKVRELETTKFAEENKLTTIEEVQQFAKDKIEEHEKIYNDLMNYNVPNHIKSASRRIDMAANALTSKRIYELLLIRVS